MNKKVAYFAGLEEIEKRTRRSYRVHDEGSLRTFRFYRRFEQIHIGEIS